MFRYLQQVHGRRMRLFFHSFAALAISAPPPSCGHCGNLNTVLSIRQRFANYIGVSDSIVSFQYIYFVYISLGYDYLVVSVSLSVRCTAVGHAA